MLSPSDRKTIQNTFFLRSVLLLYKATYRDLLFIGRQCSEIPGEKQGENGKIRHCHMHALLYFTSPDTIYVYLLASLGPPFASLLCL